MRALFETNVKQAIADEAGEGVLPEHVHLKLSSGSVIVDSTIAPPAGLRGEALV